MKMLYWPTDALLYFFHWFVWCFKSCVVTTALGAKFYALGALYFFISLWSSCKLWDGFQPPISQMLNCFLLSNYLQEVLVGQSPQVICVLHGNQTDFLFIFFSPPNAKFQTDSILRSWPSPSLQLLILIDSNLSNPAFGAYTLLRRIKSCEWYPVSLQSTQFCLLSGFTPICDERGILLSNQGLHVRWLWRWILIYIRTPITSLVTCSEHYWNNQHK